MSNNSNWHGTTIVLIRKGKDVVVAGDGQVSIGNTVIKSTAKKVRRIDKKNVIDTLELARSKYPGSQNSLDALCKRFNIDNSKREKHSALIDCQLLKEVYINLVDQKEPKLNLENAEIIDLNIDSKGNSKNNKLRKIVEPDNNELELHKKYLKSHLPRNYYN